jgi:hypothetical protein
VAGDNVVRAWDETCDPPDFETSLRATRYALRHGIIELERYRNEMTLGDVNALTAFRMPDHPITRCFPKVISIGR